MKVLFVMHEDGTYEVFSNLADIEVTVIDDTAPEGCLVRDDVWLDRVDDELSRHSWEIEPRIISPEFI